MRVSVCTCRHVSVSTYVDMSGINMHVSDLYRHSDTELHLCLYAYLYRTSCVLSFSSARGRDLPTVHTPPVPMKCVVSVQELYCLICPTFCMVVMSIPIFISSFLFVFLPLFLLLFSWLLVLLLSVDLQGRHLSRLLLREESLHGAHGL